MPIDSHLIRETMKKFLSSLLLLSVALLTVVSCDKDDELHSLKGKIFAAPTYTATIFDDTYTVYKTWRFISDTEVEETSRKNSSTGKMLGDPSKGTYILDYPSLTVQIQSFEFRTDTYECYFIDKNTFRTSWLVAGDSKLFEFTKQ